MAASGSGSSAPSPLPLTSSGKISPGMSATVTELGDKILVEVTESEYATGAYLVILSDTVSLTDKKDKEIERDDIAVGDTVKITYTGQVTMSIPPQIIALKIQKM